MGIKAPASVKFQMIYDAVAHDNNLLSITELCRIAGVSHSGYYDWVNGAATRQAREDADKQDFDIILEAYRFRGYAKGARAIHMRLLHTGKRMNVKKIRRLMKKFNLVCPSEIINSGIFVPPFSLVADKIPAMISLTFDSNLKSHLLNSYDLVF